MGKAHENAQRTLPGSGYRDYLGACLDGLTVATRGPAIWKFLLRPARCLLLALLRATEEAEGQVERRVLLADLLRHNV